MRKGLGLLAALTTAAMLITATSGVASATSNQPDASATPDCAALATALVESTAEERTDNFEYVCVGDEVFAAIDDDGAVGHDLSGTADELMDSAQVPASRNFQAANVNCDPTEPPFRSIVSELQVNIEHCVVYGQQGHPTNGSWSRSILVDWTVYPGWNSAQSRISTIPSAGSPTLRGTVTSQRQNGILPPTELSSAAFSLTGNTSATGYVVGGLTSNGSHSVKTEDLDVTDPTYSFNFYVGDNIPTPRFTCDTSEQRCYYPGGQEAPL